MSRSDPIGKCCVPGQYHQLLQHHKPLETVEDAKRHPGTETD